MTTETGTFTPTDEDVLAWEAALGCSTDIDGENCFRHGRYIRMGMNWRCRVAVDVAGRGRAIIERERRAAKVEALREAARLLYNGAPDPRQALYNYGGNPWLNRLADEIEQYGE